MEADRELLEAAAKAAGYKPHGWGDGCNRMLVEDVDGPGLPWNPLTDDGDALRLAVKLGIEVGNYHQYGKAFAGICGREFWEVGNPEAATRRAIVRAAAAIARATPQRGIERTEEGAKP